MGSFKESLTKGLTTINVKANNFMEQSKCKTYISTLENEIRELKQQLGDIYYNKRMLNEPAGEEVDQLIEKITGKYGDIEVQREKIQKLVEEERQILGTQQNGSEGDVIFCSHCGMKNSANYKFCCKCGVALK